LRSELTYWRAFARQLYGTSVRELLASGVIAAIATVPFITATFFDSDWRRSVRRWLLVLFACVAISEAWALPQEVLFARRARARPTIEATEDRWWPFQHHYIGYDPAYGFYGND